MVKQAVVIHYNDNVATAAADLKSGRKTGQRRRKMVESFIFRGEL